MEDDDTVARLKDLLGKDAQARGKALRVERTTISLGLSVVRVVVDGPDPLAPSRAVLVEPGSGTLYGSHGCDLGDLAVARGWLTAPPDALDLARVANVAFFDAAYLIDATPTPTVSTTPEGLELDYVHRRAGAARAAAITVRIKRSGGTNARIRLLPPSP